MVVPMISREVARQTDTRQEVSEPWRSVLDCILSPNWDEDAERLREPVHLPADLRERETDVELRVELPGVNPADIEIGFQDSSLTIRGYKRDAGGLHESRLVRVERHMGPFHRTFTIPCDILEEDIVARYEDGVLIVELPKLDSA